MYLKGSQKDGPSFCFNFYLFYVDFTQVFEREAEREEGGGRAEEEGQGHPALSTDPDAGLDLKTLKL